MTFFDGEAPYLCDQRAESAHIHETAWVDSPCQIGEHTTVQHFAHIMSHTVIGNFCKIGHNVSIASGVLVGDYVHVQDNSRLNSGVILENEVSCGPGTVFTEMGHIRASNRAISRVSPTLVRQGAALGANTTIATGFTVGRFAFVEAGTVVDSNIPDFRVVYGNPLKFAGWRCECGQLLAFGTKQDTRDETRCAPCGRRYMRLSKWKMNQLTQGDVRGDGHANHDSNSQPDPSIRNA